MMNEHVIRAYLKHRQHADDAKKLGTKSIRSIDVRGSRRNSAYEQLDEDAVVIVKQFDNPITQRR